MAFVSRRIEEHDVREALYEPNFAKKVFIDCTDLFDALSSCTTVTGIDRVQIHLNDYLINHYCEWEAERFQLVFRHEGVVLKKVGFNACKNLVRLAVERQSSRDAVAWAVTEARAVATNVVTEPGDLYFLPGPFWTASSSNHLISTLKSRGVVVGAYIYDLIPMTHPQFCEDAHCSVFAAAFAELVPQLDFALTISEFVAKELRRMLEVHDLFVPPILAAPLAHELEARGSYDVAERKAVLDRFSGRPFVLCVGTIEARKNHLYLLNVWRTLEAEGVELPLLVFVGRLGWRITDFREQLQAVRYCNDRIKIVSDVSDADLACMYDHCLFTIFPSFVEGWGLPVGESLARGKIAVASSVASIPEVGGKHALYIDPHNLHSGVDVVRRLITDASFRAAQEALVRAEFKPRTWTAAGEGFFSALVQGYEARTIRKVYCPSLAPGHILTISDLIDPASNLDAYLRLPLRLVLYEGWRPIDTGGSWILDRKASVRFDTGLSSGTRILLVMSFITVPWLSNSSLVLRCETQAASGDGALQSRRVLQAATLFRQSVHAVVDEEGIAMVHLEIEGSPRANPPQEPRVLWIRMLSIGWCVADDLLGRISMLEQVICA